MNWTSVDEFLTIDHVLTLLAGFGTGIALIPAIGTQNAFVLRQGLRREHPVAVASFCSAADLVLVLAAIAGVGALVARAPGLVEVVRVVGVVYLLVYAAFALRRAARPGSLHASGRGGSLGAVLGTAAALTLLNPHLYLDVLMLGSIANAHGDARWWFGAGVVVASVTWFFSVSLGAARLSGLFARPTAWRVLDLTVAAVMIALAVTLLAG